MRSTCYIGNSFILNAFTNLTCSDQLPVQQVSPDHGRDRVAHLRDGVLLVVWLAPV